ncbi:MAG: hypothetical protein A2020_04325 [Lentisphaerae bacterium GWF2_45_14]|nr:MAG: hypothetical protein A2020_04325 [Lentisphaerae bacterium GWF2_45_14]
MRKIFISATAGITLLMILTGCFSAPAGIAASTMPITSKDSYTIVRRNAEGSDWRVVLLGIPLGPLSAHDALEDAKKQNNADALVNVTGENRYKFFLLLWTEQMIIQGDAIKFRVAGEDVE